MRTKILSNLSRISVSRQKKLEDGGMAFRNKSLSNTVKSCLDQSRPWFSELIVTNYHDNWPLNRYRKSDLEDIALKTEKRPEPNSWIFFQRIVGYRGE